MAAPATEYESEKAELEILPNDSKSTESDGMITYRAREKVRSILMGFVVLLYRGEVRSSRLKRGKEVS